MLSFFKRTKIKTWEMELMRRVLKNLPDKYAYLLRQIDQGLFRRVLIGLSDIPFYVGFSFNPKLHDKFYDKSGENHMLTGILVFDDKSKTFLQYSIYVSFGIINGYALETKNKPKLDLNRIDISGFNEKYLYNAEFKKIAHNFNSSELELINESEVYEVVLNNKKYYHIKDLEDGDFVAIDEHKKIFKITHDPFEIIAIEKSIEQFLRERGSNNG